MEEEKQNKLKEEEIRTMRTWSEEESRRYVEKFRVSQMVTYLVCD